MLEDFGDRVIRYPRADPPIEETVVWAKANPDAFRDMIAVEPWVSGNPLRVEELADDWSRLAVGLDEAALPELAELVRAKALELRGKAAQIADASSEF